MIFLLKRFIRFIATSLISIYLKLKKKTILSFSCFINNKTQFEGRNKVCKGTNIVNTTMGYASYIGIHSILPNCIIGRYCSIGSNVKVISANHPTSTFVSTHPCFFSTAKQAGFSYVKNDLFNEHVFLDKKSKVYVEIANDVWIGNNVTILSGVKISDGAVIATGAVVTHDVNSYEIVGGVPAKHIKYRFNTTERDFLSYFKWWDKTPQWISEHAHLFQDIKLLMKI